MPTLQEEVDAQVRAGMCRRGTTPTGCLMDDGMEVACQTIRECAPSQHFEYSLPGVTPNVNIWTWGDGGWDWSGQTNQTPVFQPGIGIDQFSGAPNPYVNYDLIPYVPPPVYGSGTPPAYYRGPTSQPTTPGDRPGPIAPAYGLGLAQDGQALALALYGRSVVSQVEFCGIYQRLSGFACDFDAVISGSREFTEWLSELQRQQNARISPIGNRDLPAAGQLPVGSGSGSGAVGAGGLGALLSNPLILVIVLVVLVAVLKK